MSEVGEGISSSRGKWDFSKIDVNKFESHVEKSVPGYEEGHSYIQILSDYFLSDNSRCYDIGCSTGNLIKKLSEYNSKKLGINFIGVEPVLSFETLFMKNTSYCNDKHCFSFLNELIEEVELEVCDMIVSFYSIQFIHPRHRQSIFDKIYKSLNWGGGFFFFEKVRAPDARFQDIATALYTDFKIDNKYTPDEIINKTKSLKGILEPFSSQANLDLLKRAGFEDIMTLMKYVCFEGFLAIK